MRLPALLVLLFSCPCLYAQEASTENQQPLILVDTLQTYNEAMILHPSNFISISTISAQKATMLYGYTGRFGVIKIQALPDVQFVRLNAILDRFNVESKFRNLKVCIDRTPVTEPEKILADLKEIRNVEIVGDKSATNATSPEQAFINIITLPRS